MWNVWLQESETTMCQHAVNLKTKLVTYSVRRRLKTCEISAGSAAQRRILIYRENILLVLVF